MKKLLVLFCIVYFLLPVAALAGNAHPNLFLEIWSYTTAQTTLPDYVCVHPNPGYPTPPIPCWSQVIGTHVYVAVHIAQLDHPLCPVPLDPSCTPLGGFLGLPFGVVQSSDIPLTFMNWNACPGFLKGPSNAGEPAACLASSLQLCHDWRDHLGYLYYRNIDGTTQADLTLVQSADEPLGGPWVINCMTTYDQGTVVGGGARLGGIQLSCASGSISVANTTWGAIKSLYR